MKPLSLLLAVAIVCVGSLVAAAETATKTPLWLDCAVGNEMDDAVAIVLATQLPQIDLRGISTVCKDPEVRAWIARRLVHACGKTNVSVAAGRGEQPAGDVGARFQYRYHPALIFNRMGKLAKESPVELLARELEGKERELTIVCTGPLTNIAQLLKEHPQAARGIKRIVLSTGQRLPREDKEAAGNFDPNLRLDLDAARVVFAAAVDKAIVPRQTARAVRLDQSGWNRIFERRSLRTMQLESLWQLSDEADSMLGDTLALAVATNLPEVSNWVRLEEKDASVNDAGELELHDEVTLASQKLAVAEVDAKAFVAWVVRELTRDPPALPRANGNVSQLIERGGFPTRVHASEDFETDIERRWWLSGRLETENVPPGSQRAFRAVLTQDFDDRQGDLSTMYKGVVFNPVPGPPMGPRTRLSFRYFLRGTDELRVQLYSLSNGYHRYLTLRGLPQGQWREGCVDMTAMRRPDGTGGPLAENERIDDIQFYVDPRADLLIDDIVLFEAAADGETRPFPRRLHFTGWFDSGKQGQEWPGRFEIVPDAGVFWKGAGSIKAADNETQEVRIGLRGERPVGSKIRLDVATKIVDANARPAEIEVVLHSTGNRSLASARLPSPKSGDWRRHHGVTFETKTRHPLRQPDELIFRVPAGNRLLIDDVLLYEE